MRNVACKLAPFDTSRRLLKRVEKDGKRWSKKRREVVEFICRARKRGEIQLTRYSCSLYDRRRFIRAIFRARRASNARGMQLNKFSSRYKSVER